MTATDVAPSATTEAGAAAVVEVEALTAPGPTATAALVPPIEPSEAETVCEAAVFRVTENRCTPASPAANAWAAGSAACASVLVRPTVPV